MEQYRLLSDAELQNELVQGDRLDLVYDFGSANSYWLGYWADQVDQRLRQIDIYDVTGYTNNGDGTVTFHVTIKPYVTRISDGARISVATYRAMHEAELQGKAVALRTELIGSASPGMTMKLIAAVLVAWAVAYSLRTVYLWSTGQSAGKSFMESADSITTSLVLAFVLYVAWKVFK